MLQDILTESKFISDEELLSLLDPSKKDDPSSKEAILKGYYKLIYKIAKKEARNNWELNEYFQIGCLAVLSAIHSISTYLSIKNIRKIFYYRIHDTILNAKKDNDNVGIYDRENRKLNVLRTDNISMIDGSPIIWRDTKEWKQNIPKYNIKRRIQNDKQCKQ